MYCELHTVFVFHLLNIAQAKLTEFMSKKDSSFFSKHTHLHIETIFQFYYLNFSNITNGVKIGLSYCQSHTVKKNDDPIAVYCTESQTCVRAHTHSRQRNLRVSLFKG